MNKTVKIYALALGLIILLAALLELSRKENVSWQKNFSVSEKSPFCLYIFNQEAASIFGKNISKISVSPYEHYQLRREKEIHNIIIIGKQFDEQSWKKIDNEVNNGATVFFSNESLPVFLKVKFGLYPATEYFESKLSLKFTDKKFIADSLVLDKFPSGAAFLDLNKNIEILGTVNELEEDGKDANYVRIKQGKGQYLLHLEPLFLTNFYLLYNNGGKKYLENAFGYLPKQKTVWFIRAGSEKKYGENVLSFVLRHPPLKYAWWLLLGGLVVFTFFNAKRKQRIIPVIEPKQNKSVEFVQSVGNLYLQEGNARDMMLKKIQYFLHKVRMDLLLDTHKLDEIFIKKLQQKTGKDQEKIQKAINLINKAHDLTKTVTEADLLEINKLLDHILK